jgi:hypothetical protein
MVAATTASLVLLCRDSRSRWSNACSGSIPGPRVAVARYGRGALSSNRHSSVGIPPHPAPILRRVRRTQARSATPGHRGPSTQRGSVRPAGMSWPAPCAAPPAPIDAGWCPTRRCSPVAPSPDTRPDALPSTGPCQGRRARARFVPVHGGAGAGGHVGAADSGEVRSGAGSHRCAPGWLPCTLAQHANRVAAATRHCGADLPGGHVRVHRGRRRPVRGGWRFAGESEQAEEASGPKSSVRERRQVLQH